MTHTTPTPTHFTLPAILPTILPAILTGLFILTACGGGALPNDAQITPDTQKNACETNPLADGCQADAGFLSVGLDEGIGNQEVEPSVAPPTPKPVVNAPVVKKTEPVLKELAKKKTQPAPAPTPEPITSVDTSDSTPETAYSTYSSPASDGPRGTSHPTDDAITFDDWKDSTTVTKVATRTRVNDNGTPNNRDDDTNNQQNQFLLGGATALDSTGVSRGAGLRMNLSEATYDGVAIGRDAVDGIDFFTASYQVVTRDGNNQINGITKSRYHYAGILSGTDLGAPLLTSGVEATWNGSFRTYNTNAVDFQLTVTFGATDDTRTISAFVKDTAWSLEDNYYLIAGKYTAAGLITSGTVNWGEFTGGVSATPKDGRATNGTLTGLIGVQGAVAVFISDTNDDGTSGGYAGGFVAAPSDIATGNTDVTFGDWTRDTARSTTLNTDTRANEFLAGGAIGLNTTGANNVISIADCAVHNANPQFANNQLDCALTDTGSLNVAGATFGEETDSGVAFFENRGNYYAGLLSGTDLGALITSPPAKGMWAGTFQAIGSGKIKTSFMLEVTFGMDSSVADSVGTIRALVSTTPTISYFVKGTFNDAGIIKGTTAFGDFTSATPEIERTGISGVLTGLIGQDGVVGAFTSTTTGVAGYAGGFVASPITPDGEFNVVFADWTRSFDPALGTEPTTGTPQSEFLQATNGTLAVGTLKAVGGSDDITVTTLNLSTAELRNSPLGGDENDGVAFYWGVDASNNGAGYAGIFDTTDLGAPITAEEASAEWHGQFQVVQSRIINTDFTLEVTFGAVLGVDGSVGKVEAFVEQIAPGLAYHYVRGTFNAAGVIKGTAIAGGFTNGDRNQFNGGATDGILTGLIGQDGAVGAFYSQAGVYAGGFVARPTVFANYQTWLDSLDTFPQAAGTHTGLPESQFLQGGETEIDSGGVKLRGNLPVTVYTLKMAGDAEKMKNGVSFFQGHTGFEGNTSFSPRLFAGMLSGTDMGLPLAPYTDGDTVMATWEGQIRWVGFLGGITFPGNNVDARDIDLVVNYQDSTMEAFVKMDDQNHHLLLKAGYNERGQFTNGTVKYGIFAGADRDAVRTTDGPVGGVQYDKPFDGTLTGVIGQKGAVGVFINDKVDGDYGFAGGFWVTPPE